MIDCSFNISSCSRRRNASRTTSLALLYLPLPILRRMNLEKCGVIEIFNCSMFDGIIISLLYFLTMSIIPVCPRTGPVRGDDTQLHRASGAPLESATLEAWLEVGKASRSSPKSTPPRTHARDRGASRVLPWKPNGTRNHRTFSCQSPG